MVCALVSQNYPDLFSSIRMKRIFVLSVRLLLCTFLLGISPAMSEEESGQGRNVIVVSPLVGFDNNTIESRGPRGQVMELEDTGLEYGLFALFSTHHFTVNNFLFFVDVNDSDISGDVFFANYYYKPESRITLNLGLGYVYHKIDTGQTEITIKAPLPKLGLRIGAPEWGMYFNPYLAWTSEDIETTYGDRTDDAMLYGLTVGWHWRFLGAYVKYYYQDVRGSDESYHVARLRGNLFLSQRFGITTRFEYMEHSTSDDISFLIGPAIVF